MCCLYWQLRCGAKLCAWDKAGVRYRPVQSNHVQMCSVLWSVIDLIAGSTFDGQNLQLTVAHKHNHILLP